MKRLLVWDLPVRLFHVVLTVLVVVAFAIAQVVDDDSPVYSAHMLLGLLAGFIVVLRLAWGLVGTRHARFSDFLVGPRKVLSYLGDVSRGRPTHHAGHNPGSSVAIVLVFAFVLGLVVTGLLMATGTKAAKEVHELCSTGLAITVVAHVVGVLVHAFRQRDGLVRSMVDGKKEVEPADAIASPRPLVGLVFLALTALVGWRLAAGFDPATRVLRLPLVGQTLQLGEVEDERGDHDDD